MEATKMKSNDDTWDFGEVYVAYDGYNVLLRGDSPTEAASEIRLSPALLETLVRFSKLYEGIPVEEGDRTFLKVVKAERSLATY